MIANRTAERAVELAAEFAQLGPVTGVAFNAIDTQRPFDLIINATSASLKGDVPRDLERAVGARTTCYDMAYGVGETPFTQWARDRAAGVAAQGWGMLVEQAAEAFFLWRGVRPADGAGLRCAARSRGGYGCVILFERDVVARHHRDARDLGRLQLPAAPRRIADVEKP